MVVPSKEMTNMTEKPSNGSQIVESWSKLVDNTMAGYPFTPVVQALTQAQHRPKEDPRVTLIDRLWDAHPYSPYSNVVPIDFGEILTVFQRVWLSKRWRVSASALLEHS
jgi:hypothetical protein